MPSLATIPSHIGKSIRLQNLSAYFFYWLYFENNFSVQKRDELDDGTVASGFGDLINGVEKKLRKSCLGFKIRDKFHVFKYDIDEDGRIHGVLSKSK